MYRKTLLKSDFRVNNSSPYRIISTSQESINHPLVIITLWISQLNGQIRNMYWKLFRYSCLLSYTGKRFLFEFTTSEEALNSFSRVYTTGRLKIYHSKLYKVFSEFKQESYLMVEWNAIMPSSFHPSYKTLSETMSKMQFEILKEEFRVGHALMKSQKRTLGGYQQKM